MTKQERKRHIRRIVVASVLALVLALGAFTAYAYFSTRARVYTADGSSKFARIGMDLNILFGILDSDQVATSVTTVTVGDVTVHYDPDAEWGSAANPYLINEARHLQNLSVLQEIGYFDELYLSKNTSSDYSHIPYFLVCNSDGTPTSVGGVQLVPIGSDDYPFVGYVGGAIQSGSVTVNGKTCDTSVINNVTVRTTDDVTDVGLFGTIGYLGTEGSEETSFSGAVSTVRDLVLSDIKVQVSRGSFTQRVADHLFSDRNNESSDAVPHEDHHIGILAGHVEYATLANISVYYSSDDINALSVSHSGANYMSVTGIIGFQYNMNPEMVVNGNGTAVSGVSIVAGSGDTLTIPIPVQTGVGTGEDWGGSINMENMYTRLLNIYNTKVSNVTYGPTTKTVNITADGIVTTTTSGTATASHASQGTNYTYRNYTDDYGSYTFSQTNNNSYMYVFGDRTVDYNINVTTTRQYEKQYIKDYDTDNYLSVSRTNNGGWWQTTYTYDPANATDTNDTYTSWTLDVDGRIYTTYGNTTVYLRNNAGTLAMTDSANNASTWTVDGNQITSVYNNNTYYLSYSGGEWTLTTAGAGYRITDGAGHYLVGSGATLSSTDDQASATLFAFSAGGDGGYISYTSGNNTYYLRNTGGTLSANTSTTNRTSWTVTDGTITDGAYHLVYEDDAWQLKVPATYKITDGAGHYLSLSGANLTSTDEAGATEWLFSNGAEGGTISAASGGTIYYVRNNNGTLQASTTSTAWTVDGENIKNGNYYLLYGENGWDVDTVIEGSYYLISSGQYYMTPGNTNPGRSTSADAAARWTLEDDGSFSTIYNGQTRYLRRNSTQNNPNSGNMVTMTTATTNLYTYDGENLSVTINGNTHYVTTSNQSPYWRSTRTQGSAAAITLTQIEIDVDAALEATETTYVIPDTGTEKEALVKQNLVPSGNIANGASESSTEPATYTTPPTYFPLAADEDGVVHPKNTGYVVSGNTNDWGDIRVSKYAISDINVALNGNTYDLSQLQVVTRTADSNGFCLIRDDDNAGSTPSTTLTNRFSIKDLDTLGLEKYIDAKADMDATFTESDGNIYGLHFMNSTISKDSTVTIPTAYVNQDQYTNYVVPRDCIDFNLKDRGYVNFFAGSYYNNNTAFFSLYHITRNKTTQEIESIREISKVYQLKEDAEADFVYVYSGQGDPYASDGSYKMLFDTAWITSPTMVDNAVYYFEVPVNRGEYALGSVDGKYGAYLMYLDISASDVDIIMRNGSKGSKLGTIDFVYDYGGEIVTVTQTPPAGGETEDYQYYYATLSLLYTDNYGIGADTMPDIDEFTVKVRRVITTVDDAETTQINLNVTGGDAEWIKVLRYSALSDTVDRTGVAEHVANTLNAGRLAVRSAASPTDAMMIDGNPTDDALTDDTQADDTQADDAGTGDETPTDGGETPDETPAEGDGAGDETPDETPADSGAGDETPDEGPTDGSGGETPDETPADGE